MYCNKTVVAKTSEKIETVKNLELVQNFETAENLDNVENFETVANLKNVQNFETVENLETVQNVETFGKNKSTTEIMRISRCVFMMRFYDAYFMFMNKCPI